MPNSPCQHRATSYTIKQVTRIPISGARKTFKAVLGAKTQLTYLSLLAGLMVVLMFSAPLLSVAQQRNPVIVQATTEGELNATAQTNSFTWFVLGVLGGPITVAVTSFQQPPPPANLLLGKAPGYVDAFTEAYKAKAKSIRLRYATIGCVAGIALGFLGYMVYDDTYNEGYDKGYGDAQAYRW